MSLFAGLKTEDVKGNEDVVGGYASYPSDIYEATVKVAYAGKAAKSDAQNITVILDLNGKEYNETIYFTNKQKEIFYKDKQSGEKKELPGFSTINELCLLTTDKELFEQATEDKIVEIYDFDAKKKLPKSVPVLVDMIGAKVNLALLESIEDKNVQQPDGTYAPGGETRKQNSIKKFLYHADNRTVNEIKAQLDTATFAKEWADKNKGKTPDNSKGVSGNAGAPGRPDAGNNTAAKGQSAAKSLFK